MALNCRIKVTEPKVVLLEENTWYPMRLLSIEEDELEYRGEPQAKYKFNFVVLDPPEFEGKEIDGMVNQPVNGELNERHTLFAWMTAFRGGVPLSVGDELDFPAGLLGMVIQAKVKNNKKSYEGKSEMTFQNVKDLSVCPNSAEFANRASDKMPESVAPTAGGGTPAAPSSAPAGAAEPQAPSQPATASGPAASPPGAAGSGPEFKDGKIIVDGVEEECPF